MFKINFEDRYDSSDLLFSLPVHENQDIINNQIENILNYNPNAKIILHVNKTFKNFNPLMSKYPNVYINPKNHFYQYAKGLLFIHISNFLEANIKNIPFKYFIIISSNEMFIKKGLNIYIQQFKNGVQLVKFDINNGWHNFHKGIEKDDKIVNLLKDIGLDTIYGGQTEGQFYQKDVFKEISDIYLKHFGTNEINNFETEEIAIQTIFKSRNLPYGLPFTLQNYSNNITFTENMIENIRENSILIDDHGVKTNLASPHVNLDCTSIFSIKRVDRNFNNIRLYLSRKGFILNKENETYQLNTNYYSSNSKITFYNENYLSFEKNKTLSPEGFNWFGYEIEEGYYNLTFNIRILNNIKNYHDKIGLKIHYPTEVIYDFFLKDMVVNEWKNVFIPLHIQKKQYVIFIFDSYLDHVNIEFNNITFNNINNSPVNNQKDNFMIVMYESVDNKNNNYSINQNNIDNMIIKPFEKLYNIYKLSVILNIKNTKNILNSHKPNSVLFLKDDRINNIFIKSIENIEYIKKQNNIDFKFIIFMRLDSIFKKNIVDFNFYINKFNFISYYIPYINDKISNSYDFISLPNKFLLNLYKLLCENKDNNNICYNIYAKLKDELNSNNFNFIYDDNYSKNIRTPLIKYLSDAEFISNNKGYLFNIKYLYYLYYHNLYSKIMKNDMNEFYFYKERTIKGEYYNWIGLFIENFTDNKMSNELMNIKITFNIKLLKEIKVENNSNYGLKIHEPQKFYYNWINECELNKYKEISINAQIYKKNQYVILNFDNYLGEIEFVVNNFKIIIDYN